MRRAKSRCGAVSRLPMQPASPDRVRPRGRAGDREDVPVVPIEQSRPEMKALPVGDPELLRRRRERPAGRSSSGTAPAVLVRSTGRLSDARAIERHRTRTRCERPAVHRPGRGCHPLHASRRRMDAVPYTLTGMWSVAGTVPHGAEAATLATRRVPGCRRQRRSICSRVPAWTPRWIRGADRASAPVIPRFDLAGSADRDQWRAAVRAGRGRRAAL